MRTIDRSAKADQTLVMRLTIKDKIQLKLYAQEQGDNVSNCVRRLLIQNRIIDAL